MINVRSTIFSAMLSLVIYLTPAIPSADTVRVVTSIKPVHSLAAMVLDGIAEPYLIVRGANSPHGYAMRPSDAQALAHADAVFWIGPAMETFLTKPLESLSGKPASSRCWMTMTNTARPMCTKNRVNTVKPRRTNTVKPRRTITVTGMTTAVSIRMSGSTPGTPQRWSSGSPTP